MKKLLFDLKPFLLISLIFISTALLGLLVYGKKPLHLFVNQFHSPFWDTFFKYFTNVGDGLFAGLILFILLFFINIRNVFIGLATFLISGFISQLIKKVAYFDELRPSKSFGPNELHYVPGELLHFYNSFPSGHSTTAFAMFMFLAYLFKNKYLQITFAIIACLVGYSRVYLSQHFFVDVTCGGIIGMTSFICSYFIFIGVKINWFDKTILSLFRQTNQK
ncbi:phosphatase PAP2 family protein [Flavobacterium sp.]|uniref:phosphatase PAP2 family protein n=1 Tax=Flavobacterium sp. TaxID=239 RepID=UPI0037B8EFD9